MNKFEIIKDLLIADRSIRRFEEGREIDSDTLKSLVNLTRFCASGRNLQPLKYILVTDKNKKEKLFPLLAWAGYLTDWPGPKEGERPAAYIIQCLDTDITQNCLCDDGLQIQAITIGATALEIGCCIIKSFNVEKLKSLFELSDNLKPLYVLALGFPKEKVVITELDKKDPEGYKYFRDSRGIHYVPKRSLEDIIISN